MKPYLNHIEPGGAPAGEAIINKSPSPITGIKLAEFVHLETLSMPLVGQERFRVEKAAVARHRCHKTKMKKV